MAKAFELKANGALKNSRTVIIVRDSLEMQAETLIKVGDCFCVINNFELECFKVDELENSHAVCSGISDVMLLNDVKAEELEWNTPLYVSAKQKLAELV